MKMNELHGPEPEWSKFYNFSDICEYHDLFDAYGRSKRNPISHEGKTGRPHTDSGFRLRSWSSKGSFRGIPLSNSLEESPCPLDRNDWGCYFIRINLGGEPWDYIGRADTSSKEVYGIWKRLYIHFTKIAGTTASNSGSPTKKFEAMRQSAIKLGENTNTPEFFASRVQIALLKLDKNIIENSYQGSVLAEQNAHRLYKEKRGYLPKLCDTDESTEVKSPFGLSGLQSLIIGSVDS